MSPRFMTILAILFLIVLTSLYLLVKFIERSSVFYPGKLIHTTPASVGLAYEDIFISTSDGVKINGWFVKSAVQPASTIIFAHGNAGTIGERILKVKFWHDMGCNILIFDYRGYGKSEGHPSEKGIYLDALAVYDYLQTRSDIDHARIIAYGASLGGAVVVDLATKRKLAALMVESSITSAADMARRLYPSLPAFFMSIKFDSIGKIGKITVPKIFMHSREDHIVPFEMGRKLYEKAKEPKAFLEIYGGHYEGGIVHDFRVKEGLKQFLQKYSL
ncbi:MAG: alpha/beta hydrolase [Candidatus Omnitrophica bacterium]|nr:alpha/beta hydrolase [Candidatus Omnitrophota bacterium]